MVKKSNVYRHQEMCNAARIINGKLPEVKKSRSKFKCTFARHVLARLIEKVNLTYIG